jgi:hypothetical protein
MVDFPYIDICFSLLKLRSLDIKCRSIFHVSLHNLENSSGEVLYVSHNLFFSPLSRVDIRSRDKVDLPC